MQPHMSTTSPSSQALEMLVKPNSYAPSDAEIIKAITFVWRTNLDSYNLLDNTAIHACIITRYPSWILSEKRLKEVRARRAAKRRPKPRRAEPEPVPRWQPTAEDVKKRNDAYVFRDEWRLVERARVAELSGTFEITSGELVWGALEDLVAGMKTKEHDVPVTEPKENINGPGSTIVSLGWRFRAAAKPGIWKIVRLNPIPATQEQPTGFFIYHSSISDPIPLLASAREVSYGIYSNPRVSWVGRYDWAGHGGAEGDAKRTIADMDPEEWADAWARLWEIYLTGRWMDLVRHRDSKRWSRIEDFGSTAAFFVDACKAPEVVKLLTRPSDLDLRMKERKSSSLFSGDGSPQPFGCHLCPEKQEFDVARLIYSGQKSDKFPEDDELIGVWYDMRHWMYYEEEVTQDPAMFDV